LYVRPSVHFFTEFLFNFVWFLVRDQFKGKIIGLYVAWAINFKIVGVMINWPFYRYVSPNKRIG